PRHGHSRAGLEWIERFVGEPMADHAACAGLDVELRVHPEIDDLRDRPHEPRSVLGRPAVDRSDLDPLGANGVPEGVAGSRIGADTHDDALALVEALHGIT